VRIFIAYGFGLHLGRLGDDVWPEGRYCGDDVEGIVMVCILVKLRYLNVVYRGGDNLNLQEMSIIIIILAIKLVAPKA